MVKALIAGGIAALTMTVTACGSSSSVPSTVTINFNVTGSTITPANPKAVKGQNLSMVITTDKDEEVHFHGYDIQFDCKANTPLSKTFTLDKSGSFDIELEATSTHLTNFEVSPS
jgi:methyl coenzyme M reductase alpha subunit